MFLLRAEIDIDSVTRRHERRGEEKEGRRPSDLEPVFCRPGLCSVSSSDMLLSTDSLKVVCWLVC